MSVLVMILACLGCLATGVCLGVNLVSHNNKMARRIMEKQNKMNKSVSESLALLSEGIGYTILLSNEPKTVEKLLSFKKTIDHLKKMMC